MTDVPPFSNFHHGREAKSSPGIAMPGLGSVPADRLLVLMGGVSAVLFGLITFVLAAADGNAFTPIGPFGAGGMVLAFVLTLLFGILLVLEAVKMGPSPAEGSVLAFTFSLVLLIFGGIAGVVGGILGIAGGGFALAKNLKWN